MLGSKIIFYNSLDLLSESFNNKFEQYSHVSGLKLLQLMTRFWTSTVFSIVDRSKQRTIPINTAVLPHLELPTFRESSTSLDDICQARARFLLDHAKATNRKLCLLYSGGVDSTLILISFLKVASDEELDNYVYIFLSEFSRSENPKFYDDYLIPKFKNLRSSYIFHRQLGHNKNIFVGGECCDQMFGSSIFAQLEEIYGPVVFDLSASEDNIMTIFLRGTGKYNRLSFPQAVALFQFYDPIIQTCPVKIETAYHYFWWLNFVLKWQSVYTRLSSHCSEELRSTLHYEDNYTMFYSTPEFQIWALNNHNNTIKGDWQSYKYVCKEIIYKFNNDLYYRDHKIKYGSLFQILKSKTQYSVIDDAGNFYENYPEFTFLQKSDLGDLQNSFCYLDSNN